MALSAWAEVTSLEHRHGGQGWELGNCLWSPTASKDGADRYAVMRLPQEGDTVFHLVSGVLDWAPRARLLYGVSEVLRPAKVVKEEPPYPGIWKGAPSYYRIDLRDFQVSRTKASMDEVERGLSEQILSDLVVRPTYYPYAPYRDGFRGAQGIYLTLLSAPLQHAFAGLIDREEGSERTDTSEVTYEFAEGQRSFRETWFFKRNPGLRREAIRRHGLTCAACQFDFGATYGKAGDGYIEMHHLNPLAERVDAAKGRPIMTTIDDVVPLCANCHRVVHRKRPALTMSALTEALTIATPDGGF